MTAAAIQATRAADDCHGCHGRKIPGTLIASSNQSNTTAHDTVAGRGSPASVGATSATGAVGGAYGFRAVVWFISSILLSTRTVSVSQSLLECSLCGALFVPRNRVYYCCVARAPRLGCRRGAAATATLLPPTT